LSLKSVIAGLFLAVSGVGSLAAQDAASVVLVEHGGKVCVGGTDVIWVVGNGKVMRWRQRDGAVSEIRLPDLDHIDMGRGGILACLVRPDDSIDLYYEEYFNIPGTRLNRVGWDENRRLQTVWLSGLRHRALLTISVPEGGYVEDTIRIVPELGVTVHGPVVERVADGLQYKVELPDGARIIGVWPMSRRWPVEPSDLVLCYAFAEPLGRGMYCRPCGASIDDPETNDCRSPEHRLDELAIYSHRGGVSLRPQVTCFAGLCWS
jgi:hypothetical protein